MDLFKRARLSPDFIAVPAEPSGAELVAPAEARQFSAAQVVTLIDGHLCDQSGLLPDDRNTELIDVLLSLRNLLTVPVIPGRSS